MSAEQQIACTAKPLAARESRASGTPLKPVIATGAFNYDSIPVGYYQTVVDAGHPVRRAWHLQKFERVIECLPKAPGQSILDIGCFAGTFLSLLPQQRFSRQLGVDILEKQVAYANQRFGASYRSFRYLRQICDLAQIEEQFDCITLIEVIEHLTEEEIRELFRQINARLKTGGLLILSTPNYASLWPILEIAVNRLSDVSYEEQHITKFNYFSCVSKFRRILPTLADHFDLVEKTTTHFLTPFLAAISFAGAMKLSRVLPVRTWKNPFGNLILLSFRKKGAIEMPSGEDRRRIIHLPVSADQEQDESLAPSQTRRSA
jgi:2-polyprenyl-3-methyl-5-hydroxy-6-metoxy-1,4-benzoquinol methylase